MMKSNTVNLADTVLERLGLMIDLHVYDARIVSSVHAGLDIEDSDIDIICCYSTQIDYLRHLRSLSYLIGISKFDIDEDYVVCTFRLSGIEFEIYACEIPVVEQHGFQHFMVMKRLVSIGGPKFQSTIQDLKRKGLKTEPAIAQHLKLTGDPYHAVLKLYNCSDIDLEKLLDESVGFIGVI